MRNNMSTAIDQIKNQVDLWFAARSPKESKTIPYISNLVSLFCVFLETNEDGKNEWAVREMLENNWHVAAHENTFHR